MLYFLLDGRTRQLLFLMVTFKTEGVETQNVLNFVDVKASRFHMFPHALESVTGPLRDSPSQVSPQGIIVRSRQAPRESLGRCFGPGVGCAAVHSLTSGDVYFHSRTCQEDQYSKGASSDRLRRARGLKTRIRAGCSCRSDRKCEAKFYKAAKR